MLYHAAGISDSSKSILVALCAAFIVLLHNWYWPLGLRQHKKPLVLGTRGCAFVVPPWLPEVTTLSWHLLAGTGDPLTPIPGALITGANPARPTRASPFGPATPGSIPRLAWRRLSPAPAL